MKSRIECVKVPFYDIEASPAAEQTSGSNAVFYDALKSIFERVALRGFVSCSE